MQGHYKVLYRRGWRWKPTQILDVPPGVPPIGDTSLTHVMKLAAHSTKAPTPTTMVQYFIMTLYVCIFFSASF
jgi:hypothetical protein